MDFFSCVKLVERKETSDRQKWHVDCVESQPTAIVGWVEKPSDESIETSGGMKIEVRDSAWRARPMVPNSLSVIAAIVAAP